ncbi:MAG TPA: hypothetical protein VFZ21_27285 [Gemmatimonadaceae bacterium]|nr:hypothetical protein [Gemmatimonadaceae bacterium]
MWRFAAVLVLAFVGMAWFVFVAGYVMRSAFVAAFLVAVVLPAVMNPTRHWARGFILCFDMVYAASWVGAYAAASVTHASRLEVFTAGLVPALLFGTMASLGVGRSGLGALRRRPRRSFWR